MTVTETIADGVTVTRTERICDGCQTVTRTERVGSWHVCGHCRHALARNDARDTLARTYSLLPEDRVATITGLIDYLAG